MATFRTLDGKINVELKPGEMLNIESLTPVSPEIAAQRAEEIAKASARQTKTQNLTEPTLVELAQNFGGAVERWTKAGFPTVSRGQYAQREAACLLCDYWDGFARFGLGKCKAPGCGCTSFKRWLATETCKHPDGSRWPALDSPA